MNTAPPASEAPAIYTVAVRELCEFAAKAGDLDARFTPAPSAEEGLAGHRVVASRRAASHRAELQLSAPWQQLQVRGRADGFDAAAGVLEEVKTFKGRLEQMPGNKRALHWAQAKVYGHLVCRQEQLQSLTVRLVYFDIDTQAETHLEEPCTADALRGFFEQLCGRFQAWAASELLHRSRRDACLRELAFVHPAFRPGQRTLAENSYRAATSGRWLMAQATTGIGKTAATLFALLKAMPVARLDKLLFLTAKTSGQAAPLHALQHIGQGAAVLPLRVLQLTARDKACDRPGSACHGASCDLARGFYDRLAAARNEAAAAGDFETEALREVAARHGVCRYYLAQELVRWADVVIADYNYYFDTSAVLHAVAAANGWRLGLLVDEAHNLVERAREMYSVRLTRSAVVAAAKAAAPPVAVALKKLLRAWGRVVQAQPEAWAALDTVPEPLLTAMGRACAVLDGAVTAHEDRVDDSVLEVLFGMLAFRQLAESLDTHSFFEVRRGARAADTSLAICNLVPAPFLKRRFKAAGAGVLFSATLAPTQFYRDMLGLPDDAAALEVESPFDAAQLEVRIARRISTRFAARQRSLLPMAALMAAQFARRPGNYMAFLSSFDYLDAALGAFSAHQPSIKTWRQERRMSDLEKTQFLSQFDPAGQGIGFAVLGGSFSEGIDLPGSRLIGAFVATLGMPQVNAANEHMRVRMQALFDRGYEYTYLYPGLRKVVQAAGRVVRTPSDRGVLVLMDDRFARPEVQALLPAWWKLQRE